ncbi:DEAD/DEAH box helicase [Deinococcus psychrotolerans]|uniref:DNA 3'-5' helicase n=1 Tax=Deinococcus psychrotolerans TaxID=2489213 RepID=A0A3G8YT00_9DEIO|nr:DEAD/DEAH box helicase family protein [Deinococcus psychrotolerans]AZI44376.1 DEAD/DEAH box helicase [Deinococcus psychrotolerans]
MTVKLKYDRGTLITWETPQVIAPLFTWDDRSQLYRAPGQCYRQVVETLRAHGVKHQDEATEFKTLELRVSREVEPYLHQTEALAAWKQAGRQGVVVLPTGSGKTFVAQLAMRDTPRSTLICVPTKVLMHQWYSGLLAAFPDANIGLLGDGNKDQTPILIAIYESATIYAEELATRYALIIFDEVHHLPSDYYRTIATMSLAPYRLGLTATPKRGDGREADLDALVGPVVYHKTPAELGGGTLADYQEVQIRIRLSATEQARYDELIAQRNAFLWRMHIKLGSPEGWQKFINASGTLEGRKAMLAHREARSIAFGTDGKLRVLEEVLANHPTERTLIFADDNAMVYRISREFFIPVITHHTPVKERHDLLQQFKAGTYRILAASRVLNEGVDVPEASIAVVLSGTATEREYIQRLGRILRKSEGKKAVLYEVVTEGTSEERVSQQRRGEWNSQRGPSVPTATWEDVNAPH